MAVSGGGVAVLAAKFAVMRKVADERVWRVYLGSEAVALGHGGIRRVALAAGVWETTVAEGVREIESGEIDDLPPGRSRRPGGGRRRAGDTQPGLRDALRGLAGEATRGDPMAAILLLAAFGTSAAEDAGGTGAGSGSPVMRDDLHPGMPRSWRAGSIRTDAQFRHIRRIAVRASRARISWPPRRMSSSAGITGTAGRGGRRGTR